MSILSIRYGEGEAFIIENSPTNIPISGSVPTSMNIQNVDQVVGEMVIKDLVTDTTVQVYIGDINKENFELIFDPINKKVYNDENEYLIPSTVNMNHPLLFSFIIA